MLLARDVPVIVTPGPNVDVAAQVAALRSVSTVPKPSV